MNIHDRVMDILEGRVKRGAGVSRGRVDELLEGRIKMGAGVSRERVNELLEGRVKMGAGKTKNKPRGRYRERIIERIPPSYEIPNSSGPERYITKPEYIPHFPEYYRGPGYKLEGEGCCCRGGKYEEIKIYTPSMSKKEVEALREAQKLTDKYKLYDSSETHNPPKWKGTVKRTEFHETPESAYKKKQSKARKPSKWINHVKKVQKDNGISYKEAMKIAAKSYNKDKKETPKKASKKASKKATKKDSSGYEKISTRKKSSEWIMFVKEYAKLNNLPYNQALKEAGPHYRAQA